MAEMYVYLASVFAICCLLNIHQFISLKLDVNNLYMSFQLFQNYYRKGCRVPK